MKYNPEIHHRRSIRLKGYDYSTNGVYFLTVLTKNRAYFFEEYPALTEIVKRNWEKISERFENVLTDEFIIMPNHIHGILFVVDENESKSNVGMGLVPAHIIAEEGQPQGIALTETAGGRKSLGDIVGAFKSRCVNEWLKYIKENNINAQGKFWHRNYYERIIRDEKELENTRLYIKNNPLNWAEDDFCKGNPLRLPVPEIAKGKSYPGEINKC